MRSLPAPDHPRSRRSARRVRAQHRHGAGSDPKDDVCVKVWIGRDDDDGAAGSGYDVKRYRPELGQVVASSLATDHDEQLRIAARFDEGIGDGSSHEVLRVRASCAV